MKVSLLNNKRNNSPRTYQFWALCNFHYNYIIYKVLIDRILKIIYKTNNYDLRHYHNSYKLKRLSTEKKRQGYRKFDEIIHNLFLTNKEYSFQAHRNIYKHEIHNFHFIDNI